MLDVNYLHSDEGKGIITEYADREKFTGLGGMKIAYIFKLKKHPED
jgi:hypothetical protein